MEVLTWWMTCCRESTCWSSSLIFSSFAGWFAGTLWLMLDPWSSWEALAFEMSPSVCLSYDYKIVHTVVSCDCYFSVPVSGYAVSDEAIVAGRGEPFYTGAAPVVCWTLSADCQYVDWLGVQHLTLYSRIQMSLRLDGAIGECSLDTMCSFKP